MTMAEVEVKEWGNSYGIIIPKGIVKHEDIHKGDKIKIDIVKTKKIDGFGIFMGGPSFKREYDYREDDF